MLLIFYEVIVSAMLLLLLLCNVDLSLKFSALPPGGPHIQGHHREVETGETITVNCTSLKSKPAAELNFYINDKNVYFLNRGSNNRVLQREGSRVFVTTLPKLTIKDFEKIYVTIKA